MRGIQRGSSLQHWTEKEIPSCQDPHSQGSHYHTRAARRALWPIKSHQSTTDLQSVRGSSTRERVILQQRGRPVFYSAWKIFQSCFMPHGHSAAGSATIRQLAHT